MRGALIAGFADGTCGVYKINMQKSKSQFQCLLKNRVEFGMQVNCINELADGKVAIGISNLI